MPYEPPTGRANRRPDPGGGDSRAPTPEGRGSTDEDGAGVSARTSGPCSRSHDHAGVRPWAATLEEGVGVPSAGAGGECLLPIQIDHRRCAEGPDGSGAPDRGAAGMQHPESDDRTRAAHVLQCRSLRRRYVGRLRPAIWCCNNARERCRAHECRHLLARTGRSNPRNSAQRLQPVRDHRTKTDRTRFDQSRSNRHRLG